MDPMMIRACQAAEDRLKDRLSIPPEAFKDACLVAATACAEANYLNASPQASQFVQPCIDWVAGVGGWLKDAEPQTHLRSVGIDTHPGRESPYLTLLQVPHQVPPLHMEFLHSHITTQCDAVAKSMWQAHHGCGALNNLTKICRSVAYLRCQAPLPWKPAERVEQSFQITKCVNRLTADPDISLGDISAQVYYFKPVSQYACMPLPDYAPYRNMVLPQDNTPTAAKCPQVPTPHQTTSAEKGVALSAEIAILMARNAQSEQLAVGSGIYWDKFSVVTGVSGSLRHTPSGRDFSGGLFLGGQWHFWQPAPSVAFATTLTAGIEGNPSTLYPMALAGVRVQLPQLLGAGFVPAIDVEYGFHGQAQSNMTQWFHSVVMALNFSRRF